MRLEMLEVKLPSTLHSGDRFSLQNGIKGLALARIGAGWYGLNILSM